MPGDPQVLQQIVDDFTYLRDVAWSVSQGLDAFVASASSGGFEGATAEALRGVISGRLKGFIYNIARAFSLAGEVVAGYRMVLVRAQQTVGKVVTQAESLTAKDPKLGDLKDTVFDQLARVRDAEAVMVRALQDASEMVSQPVKVPSLFARIWKEVEIALIMVAVVAMLASTVVTGPLWEIGLAAGAAQFAMMGVDYAEQRTSLKALLMSALGVLAPGGKGIWMLEELGAGLRGMLARVGKAVDVLANPARLVPLSASDPVRVSGLLATGRRGVAAFAKAIPGVIGEDFARAMERYPTLMSLTGKYLGYAVVNIGRFAGVMFTPMTFGEMVKLGFRGAWAAAWRQASWTGMGEAFRAGWTAKEWQTTQASMDVWRMLHGMRPVLTEAKGAPKAGPGKWMGSEERLREPVVPSVTGGASRDRAYAFSFVPSGSGRLLLEAPAPRTVHGLETSGIPAGSLQRQKLVQDGEDGYLTTRGGLLVPAESMLSPQTLRSLSRFGPQGAERLLTGDFEAAVGPEGVTIHLDGITPVPDQDDPATLGVSTWSVVNRQLSQPPGSVTQTVRLDATTSPVTEVFPLEPPVAHPADSGTTVRTQAWDFAGEPARGEPDTREALGAEPARGEAVEGAEVGQAARHDEAGHGVPVAPQESRAEVQAQAACTRAAALERVLRGDDKARLNVVDTKSLIADAREGAREAGRDLNTLLPGVRRLRRAAYQRLLHDAQQAVQEFARQPGSAAQQANGRVISGFTVTAVGDRGGHAALHHETGLRMVFNAGRRWGSRQYLLADAPPELDGLRMVVARTRRMWRASTLSYGLAGDSRRTARFDVAAVTGSMARTGGEYGKYQSAFIVTDLVTGHRYAFADEGTPTFRDIWVGDSHQMQGLGYLRYRDGAPDGVIPQVVDAQGKRLAGVRVEPHGDGELRLFPVVTPDVDAPLEHLVVEARTGRLLDQSIALRTSDGRIANGYWFLARDGSARRTNASGEVREAWPEIWSDEQDGQLAMIDSVTGATVWRRPFLGHGSDEGKLSPWLSRTGTVKRLPFTLPDRYELTVPYPNSSVAARISVCEQGLRLVNRFNDEAVDAPTELVRDGDQLSVRIPVPSDPHRAPAEFRFNEEGYLVSQEWPLTGLGDWPESRGVRVAMDRVSRGEPWHFGLTGPAGHVARFGIEALTEERALQLFGQGSAASMNPFVISERVGEHTTGIRRYYTPFTFRALVRWDTLLDDRTGLRLVATHYNGLRPGIGVPEVRNAADRPLSSFRVERLASGHLAVARDLQARDDPGLWLLDEAGGPAVRPEFDTPLMDGPEPDMPLLVHKRSLFVHRPVATEPDANGVTARFALPGGTDSVTAGYRFDRHGMLLHGEFPLTGGPEEAGELRVVMRWVQQQGGTEWPVWELKGTHAEDFDLRMLDLRDKILKKDVRAGFTLQERRTGVRRHYAVNGCLFYRDLPMRGGAYARLGVGVKEGTVRAVKKSGRQLQNWRGQLLDDGRVAMVPTVWDDMPETARPLTRFLLDPLHGMVEEILGVHRQGQNIPSCYWKFEYNSDTIGRVTLLDAAGNEIRHRPGSPRAAQASQAPRVVRTADFSTWMLVDSAGRPFYHSREAAVAGLGQLLDTAFARSRPGPESGTKTEAGPGQHVGQQPGKRFEEQPGEQPGAGPVAGPHALVLPAQQARLVADVPLPGRELAGLRLRVVETGEGPEAVRRLELLDFGDPAHPLRWTVHERHDGDGGFRIIDEHGDRRWYLTPDYEMEFREVRLTRTPRFVRFSADGSSASIVSPLGGAVTDEYVLEPVIDGSTGREIGLRVQLAEGAGPQPGAPVAWCMDDEGLSQVSEVHREISTSVRLMRREQSAPPAQTHTIDPRRQPAATGRLEVFEADGKPARDQPVAALGADSGAGQMAGPTDPRRVLDLLQSVTTERLDESGDTEAFEDARDSL